MMVTTGNSRLDDMLKVLIGGGYDGRVVLDCYMGRCIRENVCHTITTRTATDNNTWVCEIYEEEDSDKCNG